MAINIRVFKLCFFDVHENNVMGIHTIDIDRFF